ncbi:MAG: iron transporter FeoB, partial [Caulobacteraceae bacterium]|nr:iron transporter FeoB [Caulobacteraceae bacterium]
VAVAALGSVYAVGDGGSSTAQLATTLAGQWSVASALAFLAWYVFAPQCVATLGVVKREAGGKWMWVMVGYMFALAYAAALITYHVALGFGLG